jgi:hypothetical protein
MDIQEALFLIRILSMTAQAQATWPTNSKYRKKIMNILMVSREYI